MNEAQTYGRYRVIGELGRGGMAVVYTAEDPMIGRRVALKVMQRFDSFPGMNSDELQARFEREVRSAGVLTHPNIIQIYDVGTEDESWWFAMELAGGDSLEKKLASGEPLDVETVLDWARCLADALDHSHRHGVVHRDVKPANILMTEAGVPKISDFGIARVADTNLTRAGKVLGTPAYMSPEQAAGEAVDGASDQFSLAVVLYHALTGKKPFRGETPTAVLLQIVKDDPPPPSQENPQLPEAVDAVFARALAKKPGQRYSSCLEFVEDLEASTEPLASTLELRRAQEEEREAEAGHSGPTAAYDDTGGDVEADGSARFGDVSRREAEGPARAGKPSVATIAAVVLGIVVLTVAYLVITGDGATPWSADTAAEPDADRAAAPTSESGAGTASRQDTPSAGATATRIGDEDGDDAAQETASTPSPDTGAGEETAGDEGEPEAAGLDLEITSQPSGATVTFDGTEVGTTPVTVRVTPDGSHQVNVVAEGHEPASWAFSVDDLSESQRQDGTLFFPLQPSTPPGRVRVAAAYPVSLEATPAEGGRTLTAGPAADAALSLAPGEYRIEMSAPEVFFSDSRTVVVQSEQQIDLATPAVVEVTVAATPGNCRVEIDGRFVDVTPIRVSLVEGEHELRFEWPSLNESVTRTETISRTTERIFATVPR